MTDKTLEELTAWPKSEDEVTVDGMLRHLGYQGQHLHLRHYELVATNRTHDGKEFLGSKSHMIIIQAELSIVGLMGAIRALNAVSAEAALKFARDHWAMCDAGDTTGELLWDWLTEAGLDPNLITPQGWDKG